MGMMEWRNGLESRNVTDEHILLDAYGRYLANGGNPDSFLDLTPDDAMIMYISSDVRDQKIANNILEGLVKIIDKLFGGNKEV